MNGHNDSAQQPNISSSYVNTKDKSITGTPSASSHPSTSNAIEATESTSSSEAGPSRPRSTNANDQPRPTSPDTVFPDRPSTPYLDLATYPTTTLLRLLAQLLQQIAESNDTLRPEFDDLEDESTDQSMSQSESDGRYSHTPHPQPSPTSALFHTLPESHPHSTPVPSTFDEPLPLFTASRLSLSHPSALLSFHARHKPSITIEAYLLRILKYCPTTNEVFLGLLVYFDRMSRLGTPSGVGGEAAGARRGIGRGFAIDSYNIHRLVIAGVTVASKFFSDVFYTNSRYAKVGGLPPHELNELELQFLLLNDFRLVIPPDEMQRYGDRLLGYWEDQEEKRRLEAEQAATATEAQEQESSNNQTAGQTESTANGTAEATSIHQPTRPDTTPQHQPESQPASTQNIVHPTPQVASSTPLRIPSRSRERERPTSGSVSFAEPPRPHHTSSHGGLRSWVAGTVGAVGPVGGEVMTGRVASPM